MQGRIVGSLLELKVYEGGSSVPSYERVGNLYESECKPTKTPRYVPVPIFRLLSVAIDPIGSYCVLILVVLILHCVSRQFSFLSDASSCCDRRGDYKHVMICMRRVGHDFCLRLDLKISNSNRETKMVISWPNNEALNQWRDLILARSKIQLYNKWTKLSSLPKVGRVEAQRRAAVKLQAAIRGKQERNIFETFLDTVSETVDAVIATVDESLSDYSHEMRAKSPPEDDPARKQKVKAAVSPTQSHLCMAGNG